MAVVAHVASGDGKVLEVAAGPAYSAYVICLFKGKLLLTRGAVFEFS